MAIGASKLNEDKVEIIKDLLNSGNHTHQQIADLFDVSREHITKINQGKRWNSETKSYVMKTSNDYRQFTNPRPSRTKMEIESVIIKLKDGTELELR